MPYKANSIIFFRGDRSDRIFILKSGQVSLNHTDIETGQEVHDLIKTGEFFGVKSALGRYARDETAQVLTDSTALAFTVPEFEQLAMHNPRIVIKMLRVFSNQLRRFHKKVQNLIGSEEQIKPETGLYKIGEYYMKNKRYSQALYAYKRYLTYHPSGKHAEDVTKKIPLAEEYLQKYGQGRGPGAPETAAATAPATGPAGGGPPQAAASPAAPVGTAAAGGSPAAASSAVAAGPSAGAAAPAAEAGAGGEQMSEMARQYYNAVSLFSQQKYQEALGQFQKIAQGGDAEYAAKAEYEAGRCLYFLKHFDASIQTFTVMIQKNHSHPDLREALFYVGRCYEEKGDREKARGFYNKLLKLVGDEDPLSRKVKKALRELGG
jgi:CRP-like cAMP-binding protein/TolA-binding protein